MEQKFSLNPAGRSSVRALARAGECRGHWAGVITARGAGLSARPPASPPWPPAAAKSATARALSLGRPAVQCTGSRRGGVRAPPRRPGLGAGSIVRL